MKISPLLPLLIMFVSCGQTQEREFLATEAESPVIANDLSNQKITAIAEDAKGHIWLGTFRGLNKYNAHDYHQYFHTNDSTGLTDNRIKCLLSDSRNRLWIGTTNGICQYTDQDNFRNIPIHGRNKMSVQLVENQNGRVFLNTTTQLHAYNEDKKAFECLIKDFDPQYTLLNSCHICIGNKLWVANPLSVRCYDSSTLQLKDSIPIQGYPTYSFLQDNGNLWLTGNHNIQILDTHNRQMKEVPEAIRKHPVLSRSSIELIHPYGEDALLMNTSHQGMFLYDYVKNLVISQDENDFPFEVPQFKISQMFTDSKNNLWIGSVDQGYAVYYNHRHRFNNDNSLHSYMKNKSVTALAADKDRNLWISTSMNELYLYQSESKKIEHIEIPGYSTNRTKNKMKEKDGGINYLFVDNENKLWIIADYQTVLECSYYGGKLRINKTYPIMFARYITQDRNHTIWVSANSNQIYALRENDGDFVPMEAFPKSYTFIPCMLPLEDGTILTAAFNHPLKRIHPDSYEIEEIRLQEEDVATCIRHLPFVPTSMHQDSRGDVWIGTITNGTLLYSPSTNRLRSVPGTSCTDITSVEEDEQKNIWISTLYGLCKYDRHAEKFTNYYISDGIGGNQFNERVSCKLSDGTLIFGGTHGLTFFHPTNIQYQRDIPLVFEDLKIHNRPVSPKKGGCIDKHLSYNPDIHLEHHQNGFCITFSALDYCKQERVRYHYQLEGFDKYWIDAHNNREAYYANLPAGCYTFKARITNNDNSIVEAENSIRVIVHPAPWKTWWAITVYFIIATILAGSFIHLWLRARKEKIAGLHAKQEKAHEQQINQMNMSFFANVSHEFRTPLTMISGPVAQLCNAPDISDENKHLLYIVRRNTNRMLRLINQLMDFNKLENDTLKLRVKRTDIIASLQRMIDVFSVNAKNKNISLHTFGLEDTFLLWLDEDKTDKIFSNLMSNALKFTPTGGRIDVNFDVIVRDEAARLFPLKEKDIDTQYIKVSVTNTGPEIPADKREKIFERYYQLENSDKGVYNRGTGIGLYYARSLTELHHGYIKAGCPNNEQKGVTFTFILPVNDISYTEDERAPEHTGQSSVYPIPTITFRQDKKKEPSEEQKKILVVDDDTEVAHYLKTLLSPYYKIICRFDADTAFKAVCEENPDLILSDVVMPGKNGYELCYQIKEDIQLCHIPVILVTAKTMVENQVKGLNMGADAYITKPFDPGFLIALVQSQLKNRENMRKLLVNATRTNGIEESVLTPQDNAFMTELYQLMEQELSNPELDIARMTGLMRISRTKFYYKVKGLTGETPSTFFKTYKLNRAAELIGEGKYTISEIADITGFSTLSHFSKSFKNQFGVSPGKYRES